MIGIYTCLGGCGTGIATAEACIRLWKEFDGEVKVSCLPALVVPVESVVAQQRKADKRILIDGCKERCGAKAVAQAGMPVDRVIEITSALDIEKGKGLPTPELEETIYEYLKKELTELLGRGE